MTMDINNKKAEVQIVKNEEQTAINPAKVVKRPFDVAFLMLPDEKLKQKQAKLGKLLNYGRQIGLEDGYNNNEKADTDEEIEVCGLDTEKSSEDSLKLQPNGGKYFQTHAVHQKPQVFDDPKPKIPFHETSHIQKSAFTKVNMPKESRVSPSLSISPDLTYQNSLSPSPPILPRNYSTFPTSMLSPNQIFKNQTANTYQPPNFPPETFTTNTPIENPFLMKTNATSDMLQPSFSKLRPAVLTQYRPEMSYNYQQFQPQDMLKIAQPELKFAPEMRNPAAAILTSLLPPSLAALSLPAQNVCAKCNISFRMTSDLVYHMRSHHKNDSVDFSKKRREDKLKCPVCAESFRERHHLTRHMTAHQDKDEDSK